MVEPFFEGELGFEVRVRREREFLVGAVKRLAEPAGEAGAPPAERLPDAGRDQRRHAELQGSAAGIEARGSALPPGRRSRASSSPAGHSLPIRIGRTLGEERVERAMHREGTVTSPAGDRCEHQTRLFAQGARTFLLHGVECRGGVRASCGARALIADRLNRLDYTERSFVGGAHAISLLSGASCWRNHRAAADCPTVGSETKTKDRGKKMAGACRLCFRKRC
jgi:hypothetical protein